MVCKRCESVLPRNGRCVVCAASEAIALYVERQRYRGAHWSLIAWAPDGRSAWTFACRGTTYAIQVHEGRIVWTRHTPGDLRYMAESAGWHMAAPAANAAPPAVGG